MELKYIDKQDLRYLIFLMISHHPPTRLHRTICLVFGAKKIHICARCTGIYSSIVGIFITYILGFRFPLWVYLPLILFLPMPSVIDWFTQSSKLRESRNSIRVGTGLLLGIPVGLIMLLFINGMLFMFSISLVIMGAYVLTIYFIAKKTKCLDSYLNEVIQNIEKMKQ